MGGSSKAQTVAYRYYVGMQLALCSGPIDFITRIIVGSDVAWQGAFGQGTININQPNLFGGDSQQGGITGNLDICLGASTQAQNSYLLSILGSYLPAFRGICTLVLNQMYLGLNPYLSQWAVRASRIHTRQNGIAQWYDAKAAVPTADDASDMLVYDTGATTNPAPPLGSSNLMAAITGNTSAPSDPRVFVIDGETGFIDSSGALVTFAASDFLILSHQTGMTYQAWSYKGGADGSWENNFQVTTREGVTTSYWGTGNNQTLYETPAAAEAAILGQTVTLTGSTQYSIWLQDATVRDNAGGLSLRIDLGSHLNMNPAHIIRECLTDPDWGMGYPEADVDDTSFTAAADQLYSEGLGLSFLWDTQTSLDDFISLVEKHINGSVYVSPSTGLYTLKLIRDDYVLADLITLNPTNITSVTDYVAPTVGQLPNEVVVKYYDIAATNTNTVSAQDVARIAQEGVVISTQVEYDGATNIGLASSLAQRDLQTVSQPLLSATIVASIVAQDLEIGDAFIWNWPEYGINNVVMRVLSIGRGDSRVNQITIKCSQDVFGALPAPAVAQTVSAWTNPGTVTAAPVVNRLSFETPYLEIVQTVGQAQIDPILLATPEIGYISAAGAVPATGGTSARMYDNLGAGMVEVGNVDFCPFAQLVNNVGYLDGTFTVTNMSSFFELTAGTWFQIDNEICVFQSLTGSTMTVLRGCMDTIAAPHLANASLFFWDNFSLYDDTQLVAGETVSVALCTVTSSDVLAIGSAPVDTVTIVGRAAKPYPPAYPEIGGTHASAVSTVSGAFTVTWKERNRLTQADVVLDQLAATNAPEINTRYFLGFYDATNTLLVSRSDIGTPTASVTLNYTGNVTMKLHAISDVGASLQEWSFVFAYTPPTSSPTNTITATAYTPVYTGTIIDGGSA